MTLLYYEAKYTPSASIKRSHVSNKLKNNVRSFFSWSEMRGGKIFKGNREISEFTMCF